MRVQVEFLLTHHVDIFEISRVPCIGEHVMVGIDLPLHLVTEVFHMLDAKPDARQAIIRVK